MRREFGDIGGFVLEKQCSDIDIDPNSIESKDIPRLSRILAGLVSKFGDDKSNKVFIEINKLIKEDNAKEAKEEEEEEEVPSLFTSSKLVDKVKGGVDIKDISEK